MPFDQFTVEQLAGDLLPNPTRDQIIATAFHRNTMTNTEGGTDDEEWRVAAVKDRTNVTVQAWMGLTMGCAECHTHKYDPITQREYYSFFAFFNQTEDADRPNEAPTMPVPTSEQERKQGETRRRRSRRCRRRSTTRRRSPRSRRSGRARSATASAGWVVLQPETLASKAGATLAKQPDGSILASGTRGRYGRLHHHVEDRPQGHHRVPRRGAARREPAATRAPAAATTGTSSSTS